MECKSDYICICHPNISVLSIYVDDVVTIHRKFAVNLITNFKPVLNSVRSWCHICVTVQQALTVRSLWICVYTHPMASPISTSVSLNSFSIARSISSCLFVVALFHHRRIPIPLRTFPSSFFLPEAVATEIVARCFFMENNSTNVFSTSHKNNFIVNTRVYLTLLECTLLVKHRLYTYRWCAHTKLNSPHAHLNSASYKYARACKGGGVGGERLHETRVNVCSEGCWRMRVSRCSCIRCTLRGVSMEWRSFSSRCHSPLFGVTSSTACSRLIYHSNSQ